MPLKSIFDQNKTDNRLDVLCPGSEPHYSTMVSFIKIPGHITLYTSITQITIDFLSLPSYAGVSVFNNLQNYIKSKSECI